MRYLKLIKDINAGKYYGIIHKGCIMSEQMWCYIIGRNYSHEIINTKNSSSDKEYWEEYELIN